MSWKHLAAVELRTTPSCQSKTQVVNHAFACAVDAMFSVRHHGVVVRYRTVQAVAQCLRLPWILPSVQGNRLLKVSSDIQWRRSDLLRGHPRRASAGVCKQQQTKGRKLWRK